MVDPILGITIPEPNGGRMLLGAAPSSSSFVDTVSTITVDGTDYPIISDVANIRVDVTIDQTFQPTAIKVGDNDISASAYTLLKLYRDTFNSHIEVNVPIGSMTTVMQLVSVNTGNECLTFYGLVPDMSVLGLGTGSAIIALFVFDGSATNTQIIPITEGHIGG